MPITARNMQLSTTAALTPRYAYGRKCLEAYLRRLAYQHTSRHPQSMAQCCGHRDGALSLRVDIEFSGPTSDRASENRHPQTKADEIVCQNHPAAATLRGETSGTRRQAVRPRTVGKDRGPDNDSGGWSDSREAGD